MAFGKRRENEAYEAFKYRIYPTEKQKKQIDKTIECCRLLWNLELDYCIRHKLDDGRYPKMISYTSFKKDYPILNEADSNALSYTMLRLDQAFKTFFKELKESKGKKIPYEEKYVKRARIAKARDKDYELKISDMKGHPQFKSDDWKGSYSTSNTVHPQRPLKNSIRIEQGGKMIQLPKLGKVPIVLHRPIPHSHMIKSATVSHTSTDQYYVSILCAYEKENVKVNEHQMILYHDSPYSLYVDETGERKKLEFDSQPIVERIRRLNQIMANKKVHSNHRRKLQLKINKLYEHMDLKISHEFHRITSELAKQYDIIVLNKVETKSMMMHSANEDVSKQELAERNRAISALSWGKFIMQLQHKLLKKGGELILLQKPEEILTPQQWFQHVKTIEIKTN